ncbi:Fe-S hydro-lyase, tartrate dehydratase beta-type,catalytic domain [Moorella glycerini]|uniref:L(+)-tartrate dehydratase subunit beta n=1 Tax=Neomoorella stamsii TaxID=1266720 RepID=A0A9X7J5H1_9FIRM|nr:MULTISPECIES: FumA C-terminus/TtdB family hydratase beta subunit [Moorella]PRR76428.1 L(+)-tartrate dehydratase subunit beta [Moorella stamsii]CEP67003.1 Fe-S hydro-lyase, tartrate dehydratase beta-type,catalytic domain [Moorella glycerini]
MKLYNINLPLAKDDPIVSQLRVGDMVQINGYIFGVRDATLIRIFDKKVPPPTSLQGGACLHTAPSVKKIGEGKYEKVCVGTTTSTRMSRFTEGLLGTYGVNFIIGKGGLYRDGVEALKKYGGCYLSIVGGAAALETTQIEEIEEVWWEDLMPECLWKFRVKDFGPLIVSIDSHGGNLYTEVKAKAEATLKELFIIKELV